MKDLIKINGTRKINGKEIKVIEGGFGENQKILNDKQISEIHSVKPYHIREAIKNNIKRFKNEIDIIDLKGICDVDTLVEMGYHKASITQASNLYALSERGYSKLIKIMDTDLAWDIHDEIMDNYFAMREVINSDEQLKANLLLSIYNGGQEGILASKQLTELEVKEATTPLLAKIEEDKPLVNFAEQVVSSSDNIQVGDFAKIIKDEDINLGRNRLYQWLRDNRYIMKDNKPYQNRVEQGLFLMDEYVYNTPYKKGCIGFKTLITPKGQIYLIEKLKKEFK